MTLALPLLASCGAPAADDRPWIVDRFDDIKVIRYEVPGFENLPLEQKELVYYLSEAAKCGRDILYCCASPAEICAPYQGKVFLLLAGTPLAHGQTLLSEGQGTEGTFLRVLCDRPPEGGVPAQPTLEDAFLAIYGEGQP